MVTFIGLRCVQIDENNPASFMGGLNKFVVRHFNTDFINLVDENYMTISTKDGKMYRVDEESLQIFLSAMYGENHLAGGDKLHEDE